MNRIPHLLLALGLALTCTLVSRAQYTDLSNGFDPDAYENGVQPPLWEKEFSDNDAKTDFRKLRNFLMNRNEVLNQLNELLLQYPDNQYYTNRVNGYLDEINRLMGPKGGDERKQVKVNGVLLAAYYQYIDQGGVTGPSYNPYVHPDKLSMSELEDMQTFFTAQKKEMAIQDSVRARIKKNIHVVKTDISNCNNQLDITLAPEIRQQRFRTNMSITFSALIGLLLLVFFTMLFLRSGKNLSKELLSGNGLQFITLFVLIIAIILFGILNILGGSELAAILSGISGYILGKGVGNPIAPAGGGPENPPVTPPQNPAVPPGGN